MIRHRYLKLTLAMVLQNVLFLTRVVISVIKSCAATYYKCVNTNFKRIVTHCKRAITHSRKVITCCEYVITASVALFLRTENPQMLLD